MYSSVHFGDSKQNFLIYFYDQYYTYYSDNHRHDFCCICTIFLQAIYTKKVIGGLGKQGVLDLPHSYIIGLCPVLTIKDMR